MEKNQLRTIFSEVLSIPEEQVIDELEYNSIPEWDSVAHMALVAAIDDAFDIMVDTEDVIDFSSYKKVKEILRSKYGVDC
ncbi:acyl carrier protein [Marinicrinis lubricantis]|uniref:Acyl carrier protein n=1 Tax=Marinicrinis lubricantis TaxID=2086470 RepID=A0ABW1IR29_9BACL